MDTVVGLITLLGAVFAYLVRYIRFEYVDLIQSSNLNKKIYRTIRALLVIIIIIILYNIVYHLLFVNDLTITTSLISLLIKEFEININDFNNAFAMLGPLLIGFLIGIIIIIVYSFHLLGLFWNLFLNRLIIIASRVIALFQVRKLSFLFNQLVDLLKKLLLLFVFIIFGLYLSIPHIITIVLLYMPLFAGILYDIEIIYFEIQLILMVFIIYLLYIHSRFERPTIKLQKYYDTFNKYPYTKQVGFIIK
jgi:hypothetical protein